MPLTSLDEWKSLPILWRRLTHAGIAVLVGTVACSSEPASGGSATASGIGAGGTAGGIGVGGAAGSPFNMAGCENKDPAEVTTGEDCFYPCAGGANSWRCDTVTVQLSEPVAAADIEVRVETSLGDSFVCGASCVGQEEGGADPWLTLDGDPVQTVSIRTSDGNVYEPTWFDAAVEQNGSPIGSARFEALEYQCHDYSSDDWCWEARSVELAVTPAH